MSFPPIFRTRREILSDVSRYLEESRDEVILDMEGDQDTLALASTCYGAAVRECVPTGTGHFLLKVRPDMRRLLLLQLRGIYGAFQVHCFPEDPAKRWLLTGEAFLRFAPEANDGAEASQSRGGLRGVSRGDPSTERHLRSAGRLCRESPGHLRPPSKAAVPATGFPRGGFRRGHEKEQSLGGIRLDRRK